MIRMMVIIDDADCIPDEKEPNKVPKVSDTTLEYMFTCLTLHMYEQLKGKDFYTCTAIIEMPCDSVKPEITLTMG